MTGFVIATDSRRNDELLFMVDRRKQRASFWSNRLDDVFVYRDRAAAEAKARSYRFNHPRVMPLEDAFLYMREVEREQDHQAAMDWCEAGWDGHKGYF
ncbi:hypothetical protein [Burkholderia seminalis]|uniref:hypothetical protein n=1 Tax=Burkholderia seminalis TaxID=488731 RepID=UPI000F593580|nr:hypothetical protein [Burkholderia seminalis]RQS79775.1 hypothetical protein DF032_14480 [Burkholderia seminalis]